MQTVTIPITENRPYPTERIVLDVIGDYFAKKGYALHFIAPYITDPPYFKLTRTVGVTTISIEVYLTMNRLQINFARSQPEKLNFRWMVPFLQVLAVVFSPLIFAGLFVFNMLEKWPWAKKNIINWRYKDGKLHFLIYPPDRFRLDMVTHYYSGVNLPIDYNDEQLENIAGLHLDFIKKHLEPLLEGREWLKKKR